MQIMKLLILKDNKKCMALCFALWNSKKNGYKSYQKDQSLGSPSKIDRGDQFLGLLLYIYLPLKLTKRNKKNKFT